MGNVRWEAVLVAFVLQAILILAYVSVKDVGSDARRDAVNRMCWTYGNATGTAYDVWTGDKYYIVLCGDNVVLREFVENVSRDEEWRMAARSRS